jgi:hypothetical protein
MTMPRLSETLRPLGYPHRCQRCGDSEGLGIWQEHDEHDRREACHVVLCKACSGRVIEPHPRLYRPLDPNEPACGVMAICEGCAHRDNSRCRSPMAKANGGPGLRFPAPDSTMHLLRVDKRGRRYGEWIRAWDREPDRCDGFEPKG